MSFRVALVIDGDAARAKTAAEEAARGLDRVTAAHKRARQETEHTGKATDKAADQTGKLDRAARAATSSLTQKKAALGALGQAAAQLSGPLGGLIGQAAALSDGLIKAGGLASAVTVTIAAISAAAVGWKNYALALDDTARAAGITAREMATLQAAAGFRGIAEAEFAGGMRQFAAEVYNAQRGLGSLAVVFRANNVQAKTFNEYLERAAGLIQRAASDQQRLQLLAQMGLPATMEWVRLLSGGEEGLRRARAEAARFGQMIDDDLIKSARAFDDAWNKAFTSFTLYAKRGAVFVAQTWWEGIQTTIRGTGTVIDWLSGQGARDPAGSTANTGAGAPAGGNNGNIAGPPARPAVDPQVLQQQIALEQQRIGILGQLASVQDQVRQQENAITLARIAGTKITEGEKNRILAYAQANALGLVAMRQQADALRIEQQAMFMTAGAAAAYRAEQQIILSFRQRGIGLTQQQVAAIRAEAAALGQTTEALERQRQIRDGALAFVRDFTGALQTGASLWEAFARAALNTLSRIADRLMEMALNNLLGKALGGGMGGGGLLGLLGLGTGGGGVGIGTTHTGLWHDGGIPGFDRPQATRLVHPAWFAGAPRFHAGKRPWGPGEVPAILDRTEEVITTRDPRHRWNRGGLAPRVALDVAIHVDDDGRLGAIAREAGRAGGAEAADLRVRQFSRTELPARVQQIRRTPRRRG